MSVGVDHGMIEPIAKGPHFRNLVSVHCLSGSARSARVSSARWPKRQPAGDNQV
jgi:hypothetical protein